MQPRCPHHNVIPAFAGMTLLNELFPHRRAIPQGDYSHRGTSKESQVVARRVQSAANPPFISSRIAILGDAGSECSDCYRHNGPLVCS